VQRARIGFCIKCGKEFRATGDFNSKSGKREQKYCDIECWKLRGVENKKIICAYCAREFFIIDTPKARPRTYCSKECGYLDKVGEKSPQWKDGRSKEIQEERIIFRKELREWRTAVFKRDNYTCIKCGIKQKIHAHHKKPWAEFIELRFDVNNGETLCEKCHGIIHNMDFSNRKTKICPNCGKETTGRGINGQCVSCGVKESWKKRKTQSRNGNEDAGGS